MPSGPAKEPKSPVVYKNTCCGKESIRNDEDPQQLIMDSVDIETVDGEGEDATDGDIEQFGLQRCEYSCCDSCCNGGD